MTDASSGVLLDTCAVVWLANGDLREPAVGSIVAAGRGDGVFVSPVSAWEVGMLSNPRSNRPALQFLPDPKTWFAKVMARVVVREAALTAEIAIDAAYLPGDMHGDPADRLLVATARHLGVPLVTRDAKIIAYATQGFVRVLPC